MTSGTSSPSPKPIKIFYEDIEDELKFWETSVVCYVLGANPPLHVIEGFVRRTWNASDIDKIGTVAKGVFIVHMKSAEGLTIACESNGILFDKKPFVVKPCSKNISHEKEHVSTIPVWVRFPKLGMHYRGERCLTLIAGMLGRVIRVDNATKNKDKMLFARVLVELSIDGKFYDTVSCTNEDDELMTVMVEYVRKPSNCSNCKQIGHVEDACGVGLI